MPNIASLLKAEIARVARKETRAATQELKSASARYRSEIAALKRRLHDLEQELRRVKKASRQAAPAAMRESDEARRHRFSAKGLATNRRRLGLSAEDFGRLIGVSGQSVYKWERGEAHPRPKQLPAIAEARRVGKREAASRVASLRHAS